MCLETSVRFRRENSVIYGVCQFLFCPYVLPNSRTGTRLNLWSTHGVACCLVKVVGSRTSRDGCCGGGGVCGFRAVEQFEGSLGARDCSLWIVACSLSLLMCFLIKLLYFFWTF